MSSEQAKYFRGALTSLFTEQAQNWANRAQMFTMFSGRLTLRAYRLPLVQTGEDEAYLDVMFV
jgi:hypothetical protein